jgi:hypothetical protein
VLHATFDSSQVIRDFLLQIELLMLTAAVKSDAFVAIHR